MSAALLIPLAEKIIGALSGFFKDKNELSRATKEVERLLDDFLHEEQLALIAQQGEGFGRGGWFNDLVDGANRLVRPLVTYGLITLMAALVWYGMRDPMSLEQFAQALGQIPSMVWALFITVIGFWFGGRVLKDWQSFVKPQSITWNGPRKGAKS